MARKARILIKMGLVHAAAQGAVLLAAAAVAAQTLAPAPYKPLRVGTVLDYGQWRCTVTRNGGFTHSCRGPDGTVANFFGKFVPFGRIPDDGYGSQMHEIYCSDQGSNNNYGEMFSTAVASIALGSNDRRALQDLWPLTKGKKISFQRDFLPSSGRARSTIRVIGTRSATVLGESHLIYDLKGRTQDINCNRTDGRPDIFAEFEETWSYAPDLAAVVRYEIHWLGKADVGQGFFYELNAIDVPSAEVVAETAPAMVQPVAPSSPPSPAIATPTAPIAVDKTPPVIEVPETLRTETAVVRLAGRVRDSSRLLEVTFDGRPIPVGADGSFSLSRGVRRGDSTLTVTAVDEWGNTATRRIAVYRATLTAKAETPAPTVAARAPRRADPFAGLHFGRYHALVIGNNRYRALPRLHTAEADARAVSEVLRRDYGFDVTMRLNATRADVIGDLAKMRATLTADDSLLVYYAGHGVVDRVTEQGYWLPVDAASDNPANWVSTYDVSNMLRAIRARHILVVADSCYSGTLIRAAPARMRTAYERRAWIERVLGKRARTALVSGGLEPVRDGGGGGKHSVFAKAFLDALAENRNVMEGEALFDAIKRPVVLNSNQTPQYSDIRLSGHEGGDFLFVRK